MSHLNHHSGYKSLAVYLNQVIDVPQDMQHDHRLGLWIKLVLRKKSINHINKATQRIGFFNASIKSNSRCKEIGLTSFMYTQREQLTYFRHENDWKFFFLFLRMCNKMRLRWFPEKPHFSLGALESLDENIVFNRPRVLIKQTRQKCR